MKPQELRNLQEAYLEIYNELDEGYKPWDFGPRDKARAKYDKLAKRKAAGGSVPGTATRANKIASVGKEMRTTLDKDSAMTMTNPKKQGLQPSTPRHTLAAMKGAGGGTTARTKFKKEQVDLYDIILSHLLDEGYASTEETADKIILNMSESWFEEIVEARRSEKEGKGSPESSLSYPGRETQRTRGQMGGRHYQSGGEGGSKTERGRKKSDKHSQSQRLRGLSTYPEKSGKYSEMKRKKGGGDIGSRFD